ncbi:MAG: TlpA family protein disulfide reductase [Armatimonadetes bacterium]|nr:TlpA family protein disulfide reductase [Armatimonadota bacterium]
MCGGCWPRERAESKAGDRSSLDEVLNPQAHHGAGTPTPAAGPHHPPGLRNPLAVAGLALIIVALGWTLIGMRRGRDAAVDAPQVPVLPVASAPEAGSRAPAFTLPGLRGAKVSLAQFSGRPVVLNFFAAWCAPCWTEMPAFQEAYQAHRQKGLVFIGVGLQDYPETLEVMVTKLGVSFPVAYDRTGDVAVGLYQLRSLPTTVFIDRQGIVRRVWMGPLNRQMLERQIAALL